METPDFGIPEHLARRMSMAEQHEYLRTRLSRRRTLVTASAVAGGLLTGCSGSDTASADRSPAPGTTSTERVHGSVVTPFGRHLAFGADPKTQMRISWQVPLAVRKPYIRVGLEPDDLSRKIEAEVRDLSTPSLGGRPAYEQYYVHAALDGLRPGTTYYYGVGHDGFDPASPRNRSTIASFRTAPASPEKFVFTAFGDQGVSAEAIANDKVLLRQEPAFHLHAGDICYADNTGHGEKSDLFNPSTWDSFLKQTEPVAKSVPWMVAVGNHDMEAWYSPDGYGGQLARFSLPDNGFDPRKAPGVYAFTYGNVGVVSLDANDVSYEIPANFGYTDGKQTTWLDRTLKDLRADDSVDFIVVFFHHCAYSTSKHASDGGLRAEWLPLFTKHQVDLVINGHNHVYERTDAIKNGEVGKPVPIGASTDPARDGIVYVTAGGGGKTLYGFPAGVKDSYEGHVEDRESIESFLWTKSQKERSETVEWSRVRYTGFSFLSVEVETGTGAGAARLKVSALTEKGERIDRFEVRRGK